MKPTRRKRKEASCKAKNGLDAHLRSRVESVRKQWLQERKMCYIRGHLRQNAKMPIGWVQKVNLGTEETPWYIWVFYGDRRFHKKAK